MPTRKPASQELFQQRPLPENLDAERLVLGACMTNEKSLSSACELLIPEDFSLHKHQLIFSRIIDLQKMRYRVDRITLAEALMAHGQLSKVDGLTYIVSLDEGLPAISNLESYARIVKQKSHLRKLVMIGADMVNRATSPEAGEPLEIISSMERQVGSIVGADNDRGSPQSLLDIINSHSAEDLLDPNKERNKNGNGLFTGFRELDFLTGGIYPAETWLFGASPGVGKTSIALQIAKYNALRKIPVAVFSLEMPKRSLFNRLLCQEAMVSIRRFRNGEAGQNEAERKKLLDAYGVLQELPIVIDDSFALRPSDLERKTKRMMDKYGVQLGVLDFIQKMRPDYSRGNENDRLTEICDSFVGLSKMYMPFVLFAQLSRAHRKMKEKPGLDDLRGSGSLEQLASVAVFPYREEMEKGKKGDESLRGKAEFIVAKNREGSLKNIAMRYTGWRMLYEDIEDAGADF